MNKNYFLSYFLFLLCFLFAQAGYTHEPTNLAIAKKHLIQYHDSGEYQKDQAKVAQKAMEYLKTRLDMNKKKPSGKKLALVVDIDETALSNYPSMLRLGFGGTLEEIIADENNGKDRVIPSVLSLYRYAKENHVAIFFITARGESARAATEENLRAAGYENWDGLSFKPNNYAEKSFSPYKIKAREEIEKQGYDIVLNIGDQYSDLIGKHADKTFKLPNPYYFTP